MKCGQKLTNCFRAIQFKNIGGFSDILETLGIKLCRRLSLYHVYFAGTQRACAYRKMGITFVSWIVKGVGQGTLAAPPNVSGGDSSRARF